jgi:hypothetical protein
MATKKAAKKAAKKTTAKKTAKKPAKKTVQKAPPGPTGRKRHTEAKDKVGGGNIGN